MKYFVTGATGFIGGRVARQLREAGHDVVAVVRNPEKATELSDLGVTLHRGDVTDRSSMRTPMQGTDGIFHLAGWYKVGVKDRTPGEAINVQGTRNVLELMQELKIPKGVYTSTLAVFSDTHGKMVDESYRFEGEHLSEYDRTKWVAHYEIADPMIRAGLPLVIVQPGVVYGPGDTSALRAALVNYLKKKLPLLPEGTEYCWAHVDDIARGHLLAMEKGKPGEAYIIAGERYAFIDALLMAEITGVPPPCARASPGMMKTMSNVMGAVEKIIPVPDDFSGEYLRINAGVTYLGTNEKARQELGYSPRPLSEGLQETLLHEMRLLDMKVPTPSPT